MAQHYHLGQYLRQRYDGFLQSDYSPFEVYYRSSDYNRTIESAQCNAAGMFSPKDKDLFVKDLKWLPIPIHTIPKYTDRVSLSLNLFLYLFFYFVFYITIKLLYCFSVL